MCELVKEGYELLDNERPIGTSAVKISQQTETCQVITQYITVLVLYSIQVFRQKLTDAQSEVDTMLSLGRSIIGQHYTNINNNDLSQTLTSFIQNWSNLLLAWQNWYVELHATGEQSQSLSEQFTEIQTVLSSVVPDHDSLLPATLNIDTFVNDIKDLQVRAYYI